MVSRFLYITTTVFFLLSSCITLKYYDAEILLPADVDFTHQKNTASVIYSNKLGNLDTVRTSLTRNQKITIQALHSFQSVIDESPKYELSDYPDGVKPQNLMINKGEQSLTEAAPEVIFETEGVKIDTILISQDGEIIYYTINSNAIWNIYDLRNSRMYPITYKDSVQAEFHVSTGIPDNEIEDLYDFIGQHSGLNMAQYFCPVWQEVGRMYFSSSHYFKHADQLVEAGEFIAAAEVWRPLAEHSGKRVAARACYNLALAAEMNGDPELGIAWLDQAKENGLINYATYYREILESRININQQLDKQMGVVRN